MASENSDGSEPIPRPNEVELLGCWCTPLIIDRTPISKSWHVNVQPCLTHSCTFHASFAALCFQEIPTLLVQIHVASKHIAKSNGFISRSFCRGSQKQRVVFLPELADLRFVYITRDHSCSILFCYLFSQFLLHVVRFANRDFSGVHIGMRHSLEHAQLRRRSRKTKI